MVVWYRRMSIKAIRFIILKPMARSRYPPFCFVAGITPRADRSSSWSTAAADWEKSASAAPLRAINTMSHEPSMRSIRCRTISRSRRLRRLRTTAFPTRLPTMTAQRECAPAPGRAYSTNQRLDHDFPRRSTRRISSSWRSRRARFILRKDGGYAYTHRLEIVTVNFSRPFRRRAFKTLRPPVVFIRARNPCTRSRRRFLG